jgi:hypothetical protein
MSETSIIIVLIFIALIVWFINVYFPMTDTVRTIINMAAGILTIAWMLHMLSVAYGAG